MKGTQRKCVCLCAALVPQDRVPSSSSRSLLHELEIPEFGSHQNGRLALSLGIWCCSTLLRGSLKKPHSHMFPWQSFCPQISNWLSVSGCTLPWISNEAPRTAGKKHVQYQTKAFDIFDSCQKHPKTNKQSLKNASSHFRRTPRVPSVDLHINMFKGSLHE